MRTTLGLCVMLGPVASAYVSPMASRARRGLARMSEDLSRRSALQVTLGSALVAGYAAGGSPRLKASAAMSTSSLPDEAYTTIGNMRSCKILNGMWQVSGGHGYRAQVQPAIESMKDYALAGFDTFDLADIYGPAEEITGKYRKEYGKDSDKGKFYTKWVPRPERISRAMAKSAIGRSLERMDATSLDLLQFHWWDYDSLPYAMDALQYLTELHEDGAIANLGLTNFDTKRMNYISDNGVKIVSNQVQYSVLDQRPGMLMAPEAEKRGIKILAYGTLLGGFLSEKWVGQPEPKNFETVSQQKYHNMIRTWGGWGLFQELLSTMKDIADKHTVSIANVAVRWVLDQPAVGGAIVGARFGLKGHQHIDDNRTVFKFELDDTDKGRIAAVTKKAKTLLDVIGDCGDEYRG